MVTGLALIGGQCHWSHNKFQVSLLADSSSRLNISRSVVAVALKWKRHPQRSALPHRPIPSAVPHRRPPTTLQSVRSSLRAAYALLHLSSQVGLRPCGWRTKHVWSSVREENTRMEKERGEKKEANGTHQPDRVCRARDNGTNVVMCKAEAACSTRCTSVPAIQSDGDRSSIRRGGHAMAMACVTIATS